MAYKFGDFTKGIIKGIGKGVDKVTSTAGKILEPGLTSISKFIDDTFNIPLITGAKEATDYFTGADQAKKAQELAEKQEAWNESFSEKQLEEQTRQFEKSQELAEQNLAYQKEYSEKNYQLQAQQYADQKAENALMREREDTAYQRQVADLKAAGLSPLMASGGASASGATVGSAPQYDMSGVSSAQGSLVQLAQEYAQLRAMSQGQYADRKNQAVNAQIGARQVLADLSMQRKQMGISFAQQAANYGLQLRDFDLRQAETNEKILASKQQREWNNKYGYRNQSVLQYLMPEIKKIADKLNIGGSIDKLTDAIANKEFKSFVSNQFFGNTSAQIKTEDPALYQDVVQAVGGETALTGDDLGELSLIYMTSPKIKDNEENRKYLTNLYNKLPSVNTRISLENWLKSAYSGNLRQTLKNYTNLFNGL